MRGFAISSFTLASTSLSEVRFALLLRIHARCHKSRTNTVPFRTVTPFISFLSTDLHKADELGSRNARDVSLAQSSRSNLLGWIC
jgi:hypothetical protein